VSRLLPLAILCLQLAACGASSNSSEPPAPAPGPAPAPSDTFTASNGTRFGVQVLATGLAIPWAMAFAPDGRLFFTERPGRVRIFQNGQLLSEPALTLTGLHTDGESGVLGLALHPSFATNGFVYIVCDVEDPNGPFARLVRYRAVGNTLGEPAVLLDGVPAANIHNGSRVHFGPDGKLYLSFGDAASPSVAQDLARLNGKILRLNDDGTTPRDNPYSSPVWTWGHRNPQGFDWHPVSGEMYESEHGQTGNDEINVIVRGANYGWPVIEGSATRPDMVAPITFFTPSVAPSGASFYRGMVFPTFRNDLFVAALGGVSLLRITLDASDPHKVASIDRLMQGKYGRLREVVSGPDGFIYLSTSNRDQRTTPNADDDRILRLVPVQ